MIRNRWLRATNERGSPCLPGGRRARATSGGRPEKLPNPDLSGGSLTDGQRLGRRGRSEEVGEEQAVGPGQELDLAAEHATGDQRCQPTGEQAPGRKVVGVAADPYIAAQGSGQALERALALVSQLLGPQRIDQEQARQRRVVSKKFEGRLEPGGKAIDPAVLRRHRGLDRGGQAVDPVAECEGIGSAARGAVAPARRNLELHIFHRTPFRLTNSAGITHSDGAAYSSSA